MDGWADAPDELERAAFRTLLVLSFAMLGALALRGLLSGEATGPVLTAGSLLIAAGVVPIRDAALHRRAQLAAAGAALCTWLLALPLFSHEGVLVPALRAASCGVVIRALLTPADGADGDTPARQPVAASAEASLLERVDGWIEEDGRRLPW
jgi:hypothetical protein